MNRLVLIVGCIACAISALVIASRKAESGASDALVRLQQTTPGTQQIGHANLNGTIKAGQFQGGGSGLTSVNADLLDGINSTAFLQTIPNPLVLNGSSPTAIISGSNSSSGTSAGLRGSSTGAGYGGYFESQSGTALYARGSNEGVHAESTNSTAVFGMGGDWGGYFRGGNSGVHGDGSLVGVYGSGDEGVHGTGSTVGGKFETSGANSYGVQGYAGGSQGSVGGFFESAGNSGKGVYGSATNEGGQGYGGQFWASGISGTGVLGVAAHSFGVNYAVVGITNSPDGFAAYFNGRSQFNGNVGMGVAPSARQLEVNSSNTSLETAHINNSSGGGLRVDALNGTAVWALSTNGFAGVDARNANPTGIATYAHATGSTGVNYGALGHTDSPTGWGVYSLGNFGASGVKSFRIDYPNDPENKYLLHYSTESPFPQNFYSGNITTDAKGNAWVQLPEYFDEINTDCKYQLTVVDDNASTNFVQVKIGKKIVGNRFLIMSSAPNTEVSWRVEANRNDLYVRAIKPKDAIEKEGVERGTYQHPELYGMPSSRGMFYDSERTKPTGNRH